MKYHVNVGGPTQSSVAGGDGQAATTYRPMSPVPVARRFPPVVQLLTNHDSAMEPQLNAVARQAFRDGRTLKDICGELYRFARSSGFEATIGVQEVYSTSMPSFPGQTVISALLMVDLRPLYTSGETARGSFRRVG